MYENESARNIENCEKLRIDMTINEVIEVMGSPENIMIYDGKIDFEDMKIKKFYYSAPSGSSQGVDIYFNFESEKIVLIECKD